MTTAKRASVPAQTRIAGDQAEPGDQRDQGGVDRASAQTAEQASGGAPFRPGKVEVSAHAISAIAAQAALECYGVVGLAARRPRLRAAIERLAPADLAHGVEVRFTADHVVIDLWVILEHSLRVVEVAHNIMVLVKYAVEQALELHVVQVNVNVQALRVRE